MVVNHHVGAGLELRSSTGVAMSALLLFLEGWTLSPDMSVNPDEPFQWIFLC